MNQWLDIMLFGNSVQDYFVAAGILFLFILFAALMKKVVMHRLHRWSGHSVGTLDAVFVRQLNRSLLPAIYVIGLYSAVQYLVLPVQVMHILNSIFIILLTLLATKILIAAITFAIGRYWGKYHHDEAIQSMAGISGIISLVLWGLSVVFLLDNLGLKVSAIVAGLGIGGIAVALAAQAILGDLFSYFVIFLDRPFQVGDFLIVDDKIGAIEHIGLKTTRMRSLSGEELVFSNKDLTDSRIHNFKKMERRRVVFTFGLTYTTPVHQLHKIPGMIRSIVETFDDVTFDRAHFKEFGAFSLNFEVVYFIVGSDYNRYMDIQQHINLSICEKFKKQKIEFAFPTQTVFVHSYS